MMSRGAHARVRSDIDVTPDAFIARSQEKRENNTRTVKGLPRCSRSSACFAMSFSRITCSSAWAMRLTVAGSQIL